MEKIKIDGNAFGYPLPVVLVGSVVAGKANFMAVAWVSRVNYSPPMVAIASAGPRYTKKGIVEHGEFSVNVPGVALMEKTDYCGLVSGSKRDKSGLFEVFYGDLKGAPLVKECPFGMACRVYESVVLPSHTLFVGEIIEAFTEERYLTDGKLDVKKMGSFTLTMPDNNYREVGNPVGKAWDIGKKLKKGEF